VELSLVMRLRIALAFGVGVLLIGVLAWPLVEPATPFEAVSFQGGSVTTGAAMGTLALAFLAGLAAYFVTWPYGREIGVLAAPAGLAVWALRTGSLADIIRHNPTFEQREALFSALRWEPALWLAIVVAGFAGVAIGQALAPRRIARGPDGAESRDESSRQGFCVAFFRAILGPIVEEKVPAGREKAESGKTVEAQEEPLSASQKWLNAAIALMGSVLIAQFCIGILARDVRMHDRQLGYVVGQPAAAQIAFAVLVSFGLAAFLVRKFLKAGYILPTVASSLVTLFGITIYLREDVLTYMTSGLPGVFFPSAIVSILPIQMVAFGTLGSITGYWLAIRCDYWRKHQ